MQHELLNGRGGRYRNHFEGEPPKSGPECGSKRGGIVDLPAFERNDGDFRSGPNQLDLQSLVSIKVFLLCQNENHERERMAGDSDTDPRCEPGGSKRCLKQDAYKENNIYVYKSNHDANFLGRGKEPLRRPRTKIDSKPVVGKFSADSILLCFLIGHGCSGCELDAHARVVEMQGNGVGSRPSARLSRHQLS